MATRKRRAVAGNQKSAIAARQEKKPAAASVSIAERGVRTGSDFRLLMSALMTDVIRGSLNPDVTNAACNAGGKLLKMVELEYKYAVKPGYRNPNLLITSTDA